MGTSFASQSKQHTVRMVGSGPDDPDTPRSVVARAVEARLSAPRAIRQRFVAYWVLLGAAVAAFAGLAPRTAAAQDSSPANTGTTTTIAQIWSAQVVQTEDLGRIAAASTPPSGVSATQPKTTTAAKKTTTKSAGKAAKKSSSTLVRMLPTSTAVAKKAVKAAKANATGTTKTNATAASAASGEVVSAAAATGTGNSLDEALEKLRKCESGGRYNLNTGNGYYGAYQFSLSTWKRIGYTGYPHEAEPATQDEAAKKLQAKSGWGQWPACARKLGLI